MANKNPEEILAEQMLNTAKSTYRYNGANFNLTDEQKASFKPYTVETVEDIIMIMAYALKEKNHTLLVGIHDRLMVSDLILAYDILIVMLRLGDNNKMYSDFVPFTELSKIDSKGIYRRCLGAIGFYNIDFFNKLGADVKGYDNPILGLEYVRDFGNGINGIVIDDTTDLTDRSLNYTDLYREHISVRYTDLIEQVLAV